MATTSSPLLHDLRVLLPRDVAGVQDASLLLETLEDSARQCQAPAFRDAFAASGLADIFPTFLASVAKDLASHAPAAPAVQGDEEDDGFGYSYTATKSGNGEVEPRVAATFADTASAERAIYLFLSSYRFLRNVCVQNEANQTLLQPLLPLTLLQLEAHVRWMHTDDDVMKELLVLSSQVMVQFVGNVVVNHEENQRVLWPLLQPKLLEMLLVECQVHRKLLGFATAALCNCLHSPTDGAARANELAAHRRPLLILLLQRCLMHGNEEDEDRVDAAFEWIVLLFQQLFQRQHTSAMYRSLSASLLSALWSRLTPEQILLLRMLDMCLATDDEPATKVQVHATDDPSLLPFFLSEFVALHETKDAGVDDAPPSADREAMWRVMEIEASKLMLHILGTLTTTLPPTSLTDAAVQADVLAFVPALVHQMHRAAAARPVTGKLTNKPTDEDGDVDYYYGYKSAGIRVLGNLVHRNPAVQDLMRSCGGIEVLLNSCNIDETNPMIREWALVALRHVCEGCEANQEYIKALAPQGVQSNVDLAQMGAKAVMTDDKVTIQPL
ncbi:hypothetical protein SPRG_10039 [Saprolegnia parasitica CBS 223.65]|uniref:Ataxin-10 domain-containing protein n=1 Tax=Saprolegnia parasitica (strain CBS 223.65) TaxID=695850 RepID=A0A067BZD0_SAPPC|nr:hypothetical protein SPRG_10039 [Saprolegnia parasitica CBS 223.65]KDO23894.1 hypothetical protein SPRG_10039 [Saprolegnia parasitica CBS 223.65]|eukprot:XP_012205364.1 hypothetical protein SPRG_10039 [Saprolegnia parasitica CBS 223.65]